MLALFLTPFIAALILFMIPRKVKAFSFVLSLIPLCLLIGGGSHVLGASVNAVWLQTLSIQFHLGIDALSLVFLYLVCVIVPVTILSQKEESHVFYGLILLLQGLLIGFFTAKDLVFFTFFFEAILVPLYFLINRWGYIKKEEASFKFIIYMIAGSSLMIAGVLALFFAASTFSLDALPKVAETLPYASLIALVFLLAFAVKTPLFPFHAWLADAYCQAPVAGTILLSAVLSKAGIYGIIRISLGLFPTFIYAWSPILLTLAIVGVLYGAFAAWGQTDFKRLIAYSSFSHVNFILAALFIGNQMAEWGAILQSVNHAITIAGLFLVAAWLEKALGTTVYGKVHGLASYMPRTCWLTLFFVLSAVALPGLNSFISEVMVLYGVFQQNMWLSAILGTTVILSILYMLRWMHSIYFDEPTAFVTSYRDIKTKELVIASPLVALILWLGLYPGPILNLIMESSK